MCEGATSMVVQARRLLMAVALLAGLWSLPPAARAQEVRYYYDALNRLIGVVDPQGQAAEYVYDAVGNLLQVKRYTVDPAATVNITMVTPTKGPEGTTVEIFGQGFNADPAQDSVCVNGILAAVTEASAARLRITIPVGATTGPITVTASLGTATSREPFTVLTPVTVSPPTVSLLLAMSQQFTANTPVFWAVNNIRGGNATVGTITPEGVYTAPRAVPTGSAVTVLAARVEEPSVNGTATVSLGARPDAIVARPLSLALAPSPAQASPLVAARVSLALAPTPAQAAPLVALALSLSRQPVLIGVSPLTGSAGTAVSLTLTGTGLTGATALTFERNGTLDTGLTITNLTVSPDGTQATATVTISGAAPAGGRVVRIAVPGATSTAAGVGSNAFTVTVP